MCLFVNDAQNWNITGGYSVSDEVIMSSPAVAEKGKFDVRFEVSAPGGHSSIPPEHTVRIFVTASYVLHP